MKTFFEMVKEMDENEMARFLCSAYCSTDDGCERCPARNYCYNGHTGMKDLLTTKMDEETFMRLTNID